VKRTSFGLIFKMGIGVALVVGTAIVYQVLSSDVGNLLPEYATLKAMGYANRHLAGVIVKQALILSVLGFVPGYLCSWGLYVVTSRGTRIPMAMTIWDVGLVFGLAVFMCTLSGLGAAWKVFRADPASLF
jgi:putative ABC transport system permease protein